MAANTVHGALPASFVRAVDSLRAVRLRPEVSLSEVPSPGRIAPYSLALSAEVELGQDELATGRFVLLHDPAGQDAWDGTMRVVTFVRAELEPEMGADPLLGEVGWSWLMESLAGAGAVPLATGGTVTRVVSQSHGSLADRPASVEMEVRASWTCPEVGSPDPTAGPDLGPHLRGWADLLCTVAGLPPVPDGVRLLRRGAF